jgi:hypothetical protein
MAFFNSQAKKLAPFSPSKLSTLARCELQTHYRYILKFKDADIPESQRVVVDDRAAKVGTALHRVSELMSEGTDLDSSVNTAVKEGTLKDAAATDVRVYKHTVSNFQDRLKSFKEAFSITMELREVDLAVDFNLEPCSYWSKSAALRGKSDCILLSEDGKTAVIIDLKSSKRATLRYAGDQLEFYSLMVFINFPKVQTIRNGLFFLKQGQMLWSPTVLRREEYDLTVSNGLISKINNLSQNFLDRHMPSISTSPLCNFCMYKGLCDSEVRSRKNQT